MTADALERFGYEPRGRGFRLAEVDAIPFFSPLKSRDRPGNYLCNHKMKGSPCLADSSGFSRYIEIFRSS